MNILEEPICQTCRKVIVVQRHDSLGHQPGSLRCPNCDSVLVSWDEHCFYTLVVGQSASTNEMDVTDVD